MLMLSVLHNLLSQILSPDLHTVVLLTPSGELVSAASEPQRAKDEIRVLVGLSGEVWQETKEQGYGMVDSELGRIVVIPVDEWSSGAGQVFNDEHPPLMLLALNATDKADWEELQAKGNALAKHLAKPLSKFRDFVSISKVTPTMSATVSPSRLA